MKKMLCILLVVLMVVSCCACGNTESTVETSTADVSTTDILNGEEVTITFWTTPIVPDETIFEGYVAAFEEAYPNIDVELELQTWEGISEKLQIALSTGDTPDVYLDGAARTAALPSLGVLAPVDDVMDDLGNWYESVLNFGVIDGTHYLVPASQIGASFLNINVTLAKELGVYDMLPEDRISWSVQDFYEFVKACSEAGEGAGVTGTYLYAGSSTSDDIIFSLLLSNGGQIIDRETNTCVANSPECVEVVQILADISTNGYCVDGAELLISDTNGFMNSQYVVALPNNSPNLINEFTKMKDEGYIDEIPDIRTYGVPTAEGKTMDSACWGANGLAIFDHQDELKIAASKEFVKFLMGQTDFAEVVWNNSPNYYPSRDSGCEFTNGTDVVKEEVIYRQELTNAYADYEFGILEDYWPEIRNYFYPEMQAVYSGEKSAQEAMDSFAANVNTVLAANK